MIDLCPICKKPLMEDIGECEKCEKCPDINPCFIRKNYCNACKIEKCDKEKKSNKKLCTLCQKPFKKDSEKYQNCSKCTDKETCLLKSILCIECIKDLHFNSDNTIGVIKDPQQMLEVHLKVIERLLRSEIKHLRSLISKFINKNNMPPFTDNYNNT